MLTRRQNDCLQWIVGFMRLNGGVSPTMDEIRDGLGLDNKGGAHRMIKALEERGFIARMPRRARAIEVLRTAPSPRIPIYDADTLQLRGYLP